MNLQSVKEDQIGFSTYQISEEEVSPSLSIYIHTWELQ